jgi:hypothetical protein
MPTERDGTRPQISQNQKPVMSYLTDQKLALGLRSFFVQVDLQLSLLLTTETEVLFQPHLFEISSNSLSECINNALASVKDPYYKQIVHNSIIVFGGENKNPFVLIQPIIR